ncbi:tRNA dihydrouridine synthase [Helicobacter mustelae]|uniref:tRNA-dihydrouridine synthase n=1 Tax=Helicobacter mustelae (strain ATCC 43772 / CCUG 25715 / CIP 103759 / LMG 18044 / NCTC 12198 / R85-136P) TaxID=679897 RepID=D3UGG6_HELM1|nr:tRNA-dihydrouridine synthase [Helicobacter mustelae]CBG39587.1 putative Dihydrouridine synthase [Helicobacter mustelae 12198]SQH71099.1 Dihydrouridine synthase [Helicobacter mustelae]STP12228.1 Dihydrouridine synthase [Helicobacter mustelae]
MNFENLLMLAPLAGYTDLPFRSVVKQFGVDITVSEMISSHALVYQSAKTLKMLCKSPQESPYAVQISGSKIEIIKQAVERINEIDGIDIIDFNCGCPAPKVANHGNGSGLLKNLSLLVKLLNTIKETSNKPYSSVKVRLGFDQKIPEEIANALKDANVDYVVVHGRTRSDGYKKERIDYESIAKIKQILSAPVIANGEITDYASARRVLEITGANGLMIGRAAISTPWIFWQIKNKTTEIPPIIKKELVLKHFDAMVGFYGEHGAILFRKNLHAYAKGHQGASEYRDIVNKIIDPKIMRESIEHFFEKNFLVQEALPQLITLNKKSS